jgi:hypothetical protein
MRNRSTSSPLKYPPRQPSRPAHPAATTSASPPRQAGTPGMRPIVKPVTVSVALLVSVSSPGDHTTGLGKSFYFSNPHYPKAISVVLNSGFGPLLRALQRNDQAVVVLAFAILFTEFLHFRSRKNPVIDRLRARLAAKCFPNREHPGWLLLSNLACQLVPLFNEKFPRYITTKPALVITLSFECDEAEAAANWLPPKSSSSHPPRSPEPKQKAA